MRVTADGTTVSPGDRVRFGHIEPKFLEPLRAASSSRKAKASGL